MEENAENIPTVSEAEPKVQENVSSEEKVESSNILEAEPQRLVRRNGRNRSGMHKINPGLASQNSSETCGEIKDLSSYTEKLSGSNVKGYGDSSDGGETSGRHDRRDRRERVERGERRRRFEQSNAEKPSEPDVNAEAPAESVDESLREGPSFEEKKFTPKAVEVVLTDRRPRKFSNEKSDDGVVSMTSEDCACPSISFFARVKEIVKSIFGKKSGKKGDFKKGGKKKWNKNSNRGGRNSHGNQKFHKGAERRGAQRRYNDRRPK